jgi:hypothetical protein
MATRTSSRPANPSTTALSSYDYANAQGKLLRDELLGYDELRVEPADVFGGRAGSQRVFRWTSEDGEAVTQFQLLRDGRTRSAVSAH